MSLKNRAYNPRISSRVRGGKGDDDFSEMASSMMSSGARTLDAVVDENDDDEAEEGMRWR